MRAGRLGQFIAIERAAAIVNDAGTPVSTWSVIARVRAEVIHAGTEEYLRAQGAVGETAMVFRVRPLCGITTADRVSFDGRVFNIREVADLGRRGGLELRAVAAEGA